MIEVSPATVEIFWEKPEKHYFPVILDTNADPWLPPKSLLFWQTARLKVAQKLLIYNPYFADFWYLEICAEEEEDCFFLVV